MFADQAIENGNNLSPNSHVCPAKELSLQLFTRFLKHFSKHSYTSLDGDNVKITEMGGASVTLRLREGTTCQQLRTESRNCINFLDEITKVDTIVLDKTGTLTKGVFEVQEIIAVDFDKKLLIELTAVLEANSTHPIAEAIVKYANLDIETFKSTNVEEFSGFGLKGTIANYEVLAGNTKLLDKFNITYDINLKSNIDTIVVVSINNKYAGYIAITDSIKEDAIGAIKALYNIKKITEVIMLSGDKQVVVEKIAKRVGFYLMLFFIFGRSNAFN
jgi:hypothetical protein